jgi:hypothetical protein
VKSNTGQHLHQIPLKNLTPKLRRMAAIPSNRPISLRMVQLCGRLTCRWRPFIVLSRGQRTRFDEDFEPDGQLSSQDSTRDPPSHSADWGGLGL